MIERLVQLALRNRLLVLVLVAAVAGAGWYSFQRVPIDSFPDVTPTMVQVFTVSPGLSPVDVEKQISYPIEVSMYGLPGLKRVQSTSIFGLSRVNVYFEDGTDIYFARRLVMERLAKARRKIPDGLGKPQLGPISTGLGRVYQYTLENKKGAHHSLTELRTAQDWIVKPMLRTVPGVTGVLSVGGFERQYAVNIDQERLLGYNLTIADVRKALGQNNRNVGGSFLERGGQEQIVRGYGWFSSGKKGLEQIRQVKLAERDGVAVTVGDVAEVTWGKAIRRGALVANGKEAVGGFVLKLIYTNTQELLEKVRGKVAEINKALPSGMELVKYYSQSDLVNKATGTVEKALLEGAVLVLIFLYLFLGNVRSTLIVVASLPLSALVAFIAMDFAGMSANLMSLGGLAIGIGMMVDGSVVMIENIFRHLEHSEKRNVSVLRVVGEAAREIARPVAFAIAIIIIVFLPLFTLQGVEGKMFSPMAYTIAFALGGALLMALVFVPVVTSLAFRKGVAHGEPRVVRWCKTAYTPILDRALRWPKAVFGGAVFIFIGSLALTPWLGTEFVPTLREGTFMVRSTLPAGANLDKSIGYAKRIQSVIKTFPEVTGAYARVGRAEVGGDPEPVNVVATMVTLKPLTQWQSGRSYEELQAAMSERVEAQIPGLANNFSQPIQLRTDELLSGVMAELNVSIYGEDLDKLAQIGEKVAGIARGVDGAVDVRMQQQSGKPQVVVRPMRDKLARYGLSVDDVMEVVETGIGGATAGKIFEGIRRFDIFVRLETDDRSTIDRISELTLRTDDGKLVPLERIAKIESYVGPKKISRSKASRRVFVQMNVRGRDMGGVVADLKDRISSDLELPPGYFVEYGGQFKSQQRAMQRLYIVVPITLGLIFLMLFSAFGQIRYAALIFLNVPVAATGGILALLVSGLYLSVPGAVGFIAVFGVAVLNGVVLVSYINQLREQGYELEEAMRTGALLRLRPVLMTASVAILGLIPLLIANDIGSNVQRPLAAVVVGGLVTSTLLTLVVLPTVYRWFAGPARPEVEV